MTDDGFNGETTHQTTREYLRMEEMRAELKRQVNECGSINEFCRQKGIDSHAPLSLALSGARPVTERIANAMGFVAETMFRRL